MKRLIHLIALSAIAISASAQDNLLAEKPIFTLGEAKTWTYEDQSVTFNTDDLSKIVAVPTNTSNVFLYPEQGALSNDPANQAIGIQGFYIDLGEVMEVGTVTTTWEGAAADSYEIYLTDATPTLAILDTEATYTVAGLGQYTENTAVLPAGAKGQYLVFQPTKATNYGWGVKIRSISATAPVNDVLTTFNVTPGIVALGEQTKVALTFLNQLGIAIPAENVSVSVSDNAEFADGLLTVVSGASATFTATMDQVSLTATVYVATAPEIPAATSIKTPIFTNGVTDDNSTAEFTVAYNGGAVNNGMIEFENGTVAQSFGNTQCVFFSNSATTGAWNGNINPSAEGYRSLCLDVFASKAVAGTIEFESVENLEGGHTFNFTLEAGKWNPIEVDVRGATKLGNLSIRFTEANKCDILLANIYFTPAYVEGDTEAPVLSEITAEASMTSVALSFSATDDKNETIYYTITVGDKAYNVSGTSGETINYTVTGLDATTEYEISVVASDGLNTSQPKTVTVTTTGVPDSPQLTGENFDLVYSSWLSTDLPSFDAWGSTGKMGVLTTESGNEALYFSNFNGQWGGIVDLAIELADNSETLNIDVFTDGVDGTFDLAPVWKDAQNTPGTTVDVKSGEWTSYSFDLKVFGFPTYGYDVIQIALTNSSLDSFAVDNLYFAPKSTASLSGVSVDETAVDVVSIQGVVLRRGVAAAEATIGLPAGLYIVGNKKVLVK